MRAGQGIILIAVTLLMVGVVMVNSAAMGVSSNTPITFYDLLTSRTAILAMLACVALFIGSHCRVQLLQQSICKVAIPIWLLIVAGFLLIAVYIPGIGHEVNSSNRWIAVGGISFQASEIAKWTIVITTAWWTALRWKTFESYWTGFFPPIFCVGLLSGIVAIEDLGTGILIGIVGSGILLAGGAKIWQFITLLPIVCVGVAGLLNPYRIARLTAYMNPFDNPDSIGYHILQSMHTISAGGFSGLGLGNGIYKFGYLPEDTTDFIFAVVCEELGMLGALAIVLLYIGLIALGIHVIKNTEQIIEKLFILGVLLTIGLQASMNILVVTALIPTKGIALPLLSSGGTGWILTAFCIGLIAAIDKQSDMKHIDIDYADNNAAEYA